MATIEFVKYEALGNAYIVVDPQRAGLGEPDPRWIARICDRDWGIGSDGVLWGPVSLNTPGVPGLRIFNTDGSEAEKSGNGLRIFSRYLRDTGRITDSFRIETSAGLVSGKFLASGLIEIEMGQASLLGPQVSETLRVGTRDFDVTRVSVGNPHCVVFAGFSSRSEIRELGHRFETHPLFPQRTNVQFVTVASRATVEIEIWERGSSYTLASGSSSCAVAFACFKRGLVDSNLRVKMPGGDLEIEILAGDKLKMTGPVTWIASGECQGP
ncbi:MAG: diaminopimelate epimerase [Bdellovibrionota bacterium]